MPIWEDELGCFLIDAADLPELERFALQIGCDLDAWPPIDGDDTLLGARLLGTFDQMAEARSWLYLGIGLPERIKRL